MGSKPGAKNNSVRIENTYGTSGLSPLLEENLIAFLV
jgi:hypothetical protein